MVWGIGTDILDITMATLVSTDSTIYQWNHTNDNHPYHSRINETQTSTHIGIPFAQDTMNLFIAHLTNNSTKMEDEQYDNITEDTRAL